MKTALYRHYDAAGELLYVGVTADISNRNAQHQRSAEWRNLVRRTEVEWCVSRAHALALEAVAIQYERPIHNSRGAPKACPATVVGFSSVRQFIEDVGRDRFESELGHTTQVVSRAITADVMPAHWYFDCRDWCREIGVTVPEHLFRRSHRPRSPSASQTAGGSSAQSADDAA